MKREAPVHSGGDSAAAPPPIPETSAKYAYRNTKSPSFTIILCQPLLACASSQLLRPTYKTSHALGPQCLMEHLLPYVNVSSSQDLLL